MANVPFTLTLLAADGSFKSRIISSADYYGGFYASLTSTVQSGDRLILAQLAETATFTVPVLTAEHSYARQVVEGRALPDSLLLVTFSLQEGGYDPTYTTRRVWADAAGRYGVDTSDLGLRPRSDAWVVVTDRAGNTVRRDFTIRGYMMFMPSIARIR